MSCDRPLPAEDAGGVGGGFGIKRLGILSAKVGEVPQRVRNIGGAVRLAAVRDWRQIGRIGLDQEELRRDPPCGILQVGRSGIGQLPGEARVVAALDDLLDAVHHAEAMQDDRGPLGLAGEHGHRVVVGRARVDDQRQADFAGQADLGDERTHLRFGSGVLAEVVQAALADRDDLGMVGKSTDPFVIPARELVGIVRVDADRRVDLFELLGQFDGTLARRASASDRDDALDTRLDGLLDQIGRRVVARRQMSVGIDDDRYTASGSILGNSGPMGATVAPGRPPPHSTAASDVAALSCPRAASARSAEPGM